MPKGPERSLPALAAGALLLLGSVPGLAAEAAGPRHLIYVHGRIVQEQQSARPRHPQYGYYELEQILAAFRKRGFVVQGEMRPKGATLSESADRVAAQVRALLASGVPAEQVTVVGASMGSEIAARASARLRNPGLRFSLLGFCLSEGLPAVREEEGRLPMGRLLAIREASDDTGPPCTPWDQDTTPGAGIVAREIVLDTGLSHGFLYKPLPEWVDPVVAWTGPAREPDDPAGGPLAPSSTALPREVPSVTALSWLAGCWRSPDGERRTQEQWMAPGGGTMIGMSRTISGQRTIEFEFMQIREERDRLVFTARPSGQNEASFASIDITPSQVVFENPAHDFPQRIIYRLDSDGSLAARIEGRQDGRPRGVDFRMRRTACAGGAAD